MEEEC
jgi:hypothetical protein